MTPYEAFKEYIALRSHFTSKSYDYFRYNGKIKSASANSFDARKDKLFFMKLAKHNDPKGFLVSNFVENDRAWIGSLAYNEQAQSTYKNWLKRVQSLTYNFTSDLSKLKEDFDSNFKIEEDSHPYVMKLYLRKDITLETLTILVDVVRCFSYWNKNMEFDPVWQDIALKIRKYRPFLQYDKDKIKEIILDKFG